MTAGALGPAHRPRVRRHSALSAWYASYLWYLSAIVAPSPWLWTSIGAIIIVDAAGLAALGIRVEPTGFVICAAAVSALLLASVFWRRVKSEPTLRAMALSSACLIATTVSVAVLHYLTASLPLPLFDPTLAQIEVALGFRWTAYLGFLAAHPTLSWWMALAYHSSGPQVALVVIVLSATRRLGRLWRFVRMFAATLVIVVAVSAVFPAEGPYAYYAPTVRPAGHLETFGALWHLEPLERLRQGTLNTLALSDIRALVTFPSFHVCLAVLTAWALFPVRMLGPAAIVLNAVVAIATIGAGGHYLPDIIAGAALAGLSLILSSHVQQGPLRLTYAHRAKAAAASAGLSRMR